MQNQGYISYTDANLQPLNTFGVPAKARELVRFTSTNAILQFLDDRKLNEANILILGGGSNILFTKDFDGIVLSADMSNTEIIKEDDDFAWVQSDAGVVWHDLVRFCLQQNLGGIENLSLIPGKNGAAPIQNIGAYGVELKDVLESLTAIDLEKGTPHIFSNSDCEFGYRDSVFKRHFKNRFFITSILLKLRKKPILQLDYGAILETLERNNVSNISIADVSNAVCEIRQSKLPDPSKLGNAGSFFKNPIIPKEQLSHLKKDFPDIISYPANKDSVKIPAGWMIEKAGWKGRKFGNCGVHDRQALVLVNYGKANGSEIRELSELIIEDIRNTFGILLEREVNIV